MNHSLPAQHRALMLLLVFFCLWGLPGLWMEAQARAEENGAGHSRVDIKDGRISVSAKDIPLKLLCKDIENESGVRFRIQEARLADNKLTIELKDLPLLKGIKRLLAHMNYMLTFDHRNKLSVVFIAGQAEHYTPPVLRKPPLRRDVIRIRRLPNRPRR
jgi:hypothetical protein